MEAQTAPRRWFPEDLDHQNITHDRAEQRGNRKRKQGPELGAKGNEWLGKGQQVGTLCIGNLHSVV